jgi:hypothetical protein
LVACSDTGGAARGRHRLGRPAYWPRRRRRPQSAAAPGSAPVYPFCSWLFRVTGRDSCRRTGWVAAPGVRGPFASCHIRDPRNTVTASGRF